MFRLFKRAFDVVASFLLLIVISPLFAGLILAVRIKLGTPVFYRQTRSGKNRRPFVLIKFRTMTDEKDAQGNLLPDEKRLTGFGHWLRSTSLDELPELLNIIKGDMSVIGPRPLPPVYDSFYTPRELKRFEVRGGLISPESVDKNPFISWDEQLEYDVRYVENFSFKEDVYVFFNVFQMLFSRYDGDLGGWTREALNVERINNKTNNE